MSPMRIDWVAPPFAGHLFPMLHMARVLREQGDYELRFLSTASARDSVESCEFRFSELLVGKDAAVRQIADHPTQVGSKPWAMWAQLQQNFQLMSQLKSDLLGIWRLKNERPHLVVADFTLPVAGLTAQQLSIPWWTGLATPCAMEIGHGVPSYLGGWSPTSGPLGRTRNWLGRGLVRSFKQIVGLAFRKQLKQLGISSIYREDGLERIYSPSCILAYGIEQFEFNRNWPKHVHFVGPWTQPPPQRHRYKLSATDRPKILVTLGTHLTWARSSAVKLVEELATEFRHCEFHFSQGNSRGLEDPGQQLAENLRLIPFVPYDEGLGEYQAAIIHGGTGITYACIQAGLPMLVWPHDYDQFDHAARIHHHGLGIWARRRKKESKVALTRLLGDPSFAQRIKRFQQYVRQLNGSDKLKHLIEHQESMSASEI